MIELLLTSNSNKTEFIGQFEYLDAVTHTLIAPAGSNKLSIVAVGGGGGGSYILGDSNYDAGHGAGAGGNLAYVNNIDVKEGDVIKITVGRGGSRGLKGTSGTQAAGQGSSSIVTINNLRVIYAGGGLGGTFSNYGNGTGGTPSVALNNPGVVTFLGGKGGSGSRGKKSSIKSGGGGAGGYEGKGGDGSSITGGSGTIVPATKGEGGGGNGGTYTRGGGVGLHGFDPNIPSSGTDGSMFDGAKAVGAGGQTDADGSNGGVRIIFGSGRAFPSTRTFDE